MARGYELLILNETDRIMLEEALEASDELGDKVVQRVKMILGCAEGRAIKEIAADLGERPNTVIFWRDRFKAEGFEGLFDKKKSGRESKYGDSVKLSILKKLEEKPPEGKGKWDGTLLAHELQLPAGIVWSILRREKITLARKRKWNTATSRTFQTACVTVVGLYLSTHQRAFVIIAGPEAQEISSDGNLICPNRIVYEKVSRAGDNDGKVSLVDALDIYNELDTNSNGVNNKDYDLTLFLDRITEGHICSSMYSILSSETASKPNKEWQLRHPNMLLHWTSPENWEDQVGLLCEVLKDRNDVLSLSYAGNMIQKNSHIDVPFVWYR